MGGGRMEEEERGRGMWSGWWRRKEELLPESVETVQSHLLRRGRRSAIARGEKERKKG